MRMLFCNIGWAKHYDGRPGDLPRRGGSYNNENIGHEICNFAPYQGKVFGYVQVKDRGQIRIERLGASKDAESVDGITVVWTAAPDGGGTAIVGWYKNATVYRHRQLLASRSKRHEKNNISVYRVVAYEKDAELLSIDDRYDLMIPRGKGGIGQSPIWYADRPENKATVERVAAYIQGGIQPLTDVDEQRVAFEGNERLSAHLRRERKRHIVEMKKREVLQATGRLRCEACGFDFKEVYGALGARFCEVHHRVPLHQADGIVKTTTDDLAIMCSNCHRIIHRSAPMLSVEAFAQRLKQRGLA